MLKHLMLDTFTFITDPRNSLKAIRQRGLVSLDLGAAPVGSDQESFPKLHLHEAVALIRPAPVATLSGDELYQLSLRGNNIAFNELSGRANGGDPGSQALIRQFEKSGQKFSKQFDPGSGVPLDAWPGKIQAMLKAGETEKIKGHHPEHWNV